MNSRILPTLAIIIAVGIFFAYVNPTWTGPIATTKTAIASDDQALKAADEYKTRETALASARDGIDEASLTRLSTLLPDSVDNVGLILNINALAARSGLLLANIDVASATTGSTDPASSATSIDSINPIGSVDLSLTAVGSYTALQAFLAGVEKSARLLDVREITVTGSETGVYNYHMTMRLYWLR